MTDRQPHNNLWAEKLLQVSMPDSGEAWAGMEAILDREMPQRRRDRRRWLLLILLLLLLIGVCNCPGRGRLFHRSGHGSGGIDATGAHLVNPATAHGPATTGAHPGLPVTPATPGGPVTPTPATGSTPVTPATPMVPGSAGTTPEATGSVPATPVMPAAPGFRPTTVVTRHNHSGPLLPASVTAGRRTPPASATTPAIHTSHKRKVTASHRTRRPATTPAAFGDITTADGTASRGGSNPARKNSPTAGNGTTGGNTVVDTAIKKNITPARDTATKKNAPVLPKAVPRKDSSHKKPSPPPQDQDQKEKYHGWVFGIGLNQFFPIGGQRGSTYNTDGLTGTLSDYLPVPMIRYYLNKKAYLQVEAQINTPQPTAKNLVISQPVPDTLTRNGVYTQKTTSASIQQLYYFNVPLSIHFNVWDNLNIGTGLQWSHLTNAIGEFDSSTSTSVNGNNPTVVDAEATHTFKGDSLYQRIKTNEFRFLLDVNYTYKRWVLGLRYNRALSNFVNIQLPAGGSTQSRNSSLQLYLRYILWDTRKKKKPELP